MVGLFLGYYLLWIIDEFEYLFLKFFWQEVVIGISYCSEDFGYVLGNFVQEIMTDLVCPMLLQSLYYFRNFI